MKLLFIGDVIGRPGRKSVRTHLPKIRQDHQIDYCIANGENLAHGFGFTLKTVQEMLECGVDLLTGGNHTWDKKEVIALFDQMPIIRPLNFPPGVPGSGTQITTSGEKGVAIINLIGHFGMGMVENPFLVIEAEVARLKAEGIHHILIDMHAETTSEKAALLKLLEGQVSAIVGTHTHTGTDDLLIASGTGFVTDIGLSGCRDGVIGMEPTAPLKRFKTGMKATFDIDEKCRRVFQAIVIELDDQGRCLDALKIKAYDDQPPFVSLRQGGGWS